MEEMLKQILSEITGMKSEITGMKSEITGIKSQQAETNQIVKALMHRTEELDAKFDGLLHTMVTKEALAPLATKEDIAKILETQDLHMQWLRKLSADTAQHELEINRLKVAK